MERFIFFPKNEIKYFNEAKKYFNSNHYEMAIPLFEKAFKLKYLKKECIKYLIDCHIEIHNYEEVYKMIENEFVDKNVDEEYLLKKYLYTMALDEQYIEASEIIKIYKQNKVVSEDLLQYLDNLSFLIEEKLKYQNNYQEDLVKKYLLSDKFDDHIQIILNLENLNYQKNANEIQMFLNNKEVDSFVKYNLLKYVIENNLVTEIDYTNYYNEKTRISANDFIDLLDDSHYNDVISRVLNEIENDYVNTKEYVKNIWLDFCVKHFPNFIDDFDLACGVLHVLLLKTIDTDFNINDVCKLYNLDSRSLFNYFDM